MRIYISYSPGSSIVYCFWKYFFRSCGVWVTPEKISKSWQIDKSKRPHLVILDNETQSKYDSPSSNIVYCVKTKDVTEREREDLVCVKPWKDMHYSVIRQLLEGDENLSSIMELIGIFGGVHSTASGEMIEEGLWSAAWLFHEIAQQAENKNWDQEIYEKADKVIHFLEGRGKYDWYHKFMMLYCKYLQCGVNRNSVKRMYQCKELLEQCGSLAGGEWNPAIAYLAGKISLLTSTENKYAVYYFMEVMELDPQAEIYYEIGHIYETAYGDEESALKCYQKAYRLDHEYYRALYKYAIKLGSGGDWRGAISIYSDVRQIIRRVRLKNDVGIRELEYEYKSCRQILWLCQKYIDEPEVEEAFQRNLDDMNYNLDAYISFKKLFKKMFTKKVQLKKESEIRDELKQKMS